MKIVEPYAKMLSPFNFNAPYMLGDGIHTLRNIEYAARVSHGSEDKMTDNSYDRFLRSVVKQHGDWSVTEHEKVTCEFLVDRGIGYEMVRHRIRLGWNEDGIDHYFVIDEPDDGLVGITQESTRFINYQKKGGEAKFIVPQEFQADSAYPMGDNPRFLDWEEAILASERSYMHLVEMGVKPQIARGVLPNSLATKIILTKNLRAWRHFFVMRVSAQVHPQLRQVTEPLLLDFQRNIPILYEDITPGGQQSEMMRLAR